jgi:hypothetical protein
VSDGAAAKDNNKATSDGAAAKDEKAAKNEKPVSDGAMSMVFEGLCLISQSSSFHAFRFKAWLSMCLTVCISFLNFV